MSEDIPPDWYDDIPSADPAIRTEYEAALGRFILAYNEADYRLSRVIAAELSDRGHLDLGAAAAKGTFAQRLEKLEILSTAENRHLSRVPVAKLRSLHAGRNNLAHGHFDQNPFDGSYYVIQREKARDYPVSRILELADDLAKIADILRGTLPNTECAHECIDSKDDCRCSSMMRLRTYGRLVPWGEDWRRQARDISDGLDALCGRGTTAYLWRMGYE